MPKMPSTHVITSPQMPTISAPALGNGFYIPGNNKIQKENSETPEDASNQQNNKTSEKTANQIIQNQQIYKNISSTEIQELQDSGLFTGIYDLYSSDKNTNSSNLILENVLNKLNSLNSEQNINNSAKTSLSNENFAPRILRFNINGKNILNSCKNIYFSHPEQDGTFLLTFDRVFSEKTKNFSETFYVFFKKNPNDISNLTYLVESKITQNIKNKDSELFDFSELKDLKAFKTGNLISLQHISQKLNMDLLIDLGIYS